jgi:hypothetical protein
VNDPTLGYLKVAWMSYLNDETAGGPQHGYVHLAVAPIGGGRHEADRWSGEVVSEAVAARGPEGFRFDVPGCAAIDERRIAVVLPELAVTVHLDGRPLPYFPAPHEEASPFLGPGAPPGGTSHWMVHTLATPARWRLEDGDGRREGLGLLYAERGWSVRQAHGFCYLMAVSERAKVVVTCGMADDTNQVWAGRLLTDEHDLTFLPFDEDVEVTSDLDSGAARAGVTFRRDDLEVRVASEAPLTDFYDQVTPSQTVFHAEHPVAKTMQARLQVEVVQDGEVVERVDLPQSIFELGGVLYPPGRSASHGD